MGRSVTDMVNDEAEQTKRLKQIGLWSLGELSQKILGLLELATGDRGYGTYYSENVWDW